jgi:hypothetical protein
MSEIIEAPWTDEQIANLNASQQSGRFHSFTCGLRDQHRGNPGVLVATMDGWSCPASGCDYRQDWAHAFMAAPLPPDPFHDAPRAPRSEES